MPANTPKSKQVKYKDSKTGKIFTITKHSNGRFTKNGQLVLTHSEIFNQLMAAVVPNAGESKCITPN